MVEVYLVNLYVYILTVLNAKKANWNAFWRRGRKHKLGACEHLSTKNKYKMILHLQTELPETKQSGWGRA